VPKYVQRKRVKGVGRKIFRGDNGKKRLKNSKTDRKIAVLNLFQGGRRKKNEI